MAMNKNPFQPFSLDFRRKTKVFSRRREIRISLITVSVWSRLFSPHSTLATFQAFTVETFLFEFIHEENEKNEAKKRNKKS